MVDPNKIGDVLEQAALRNVEEQLRTRLAGVRDSETGEVPVVAVRGASLDNLSIQVSGSPQLVALLRKRLGNNAESDNGTKNVMTLKNPPVGFLCHASEDKQLARRIAEDFQKNGIERLFPPSISLRPC
jgi:hypothetical protein